MALAAQEMDLYAADLHLDLGSEGMFEYLTSSEDLFSWERSFLEETSLEKAWSEAQRA